MNLSTTAAAGLLLATVAACSPGDSTVDAAGKTPEKLPATSEFRDGTCRAAAEPILELARLAARNERAKAIPIEDRTALTARQQELLRLAPTASADVRAPLTALTTAIGFVRIRQDTRTYEPTLLRDMDAARRQLQRDCVG
jgi:hypothetical protein